MRPRSGAVKRRVVPADGIREAQRVLSPGFNLQRASFLAAQGFRHHAWAACPLLSVKCMFNGRALYRADRAWFSVDDRGYLILNDQQPYEIQIDSPTRVESFIIFFPRGWAEEVRHSLRSSTERLLDTPQGDPGNRVHFFERFTPHDQGVTPLLRHLRQAHRTGTLPAVWLEQVLRELLARMLRTQRDALQESDQLPARRASTRQELWRRLHRARDFIQARFDTPLTLAEMAEAACLSPFHFLREFKNTFHATPHEYLSACRIERVKFLLERTELPVTQICLAVGFESLGSFSSWFSRITGVSPRAWRARKSAVLKKFSGVQSDKMPP